MPASSCPNRRRIEAYAVGKLPNDELEAISEHIDGCGSCQETLGAMAEVDDTFVSQIRSSRSPDAYASEPACREAVDRLKRIPIQASEDTNVPDRTAIASSLQKMGEYELLEKLGEGGMGTVYKARQINLDRVVALKVLPRRLAENQTAIHRFYREMQAVGRLHHPNIVQAHDAREIDGSPVLAMEYVSGVDLSKLVTADSSLGIADACELVRQTAVGLQHAHERGLVHRDIKPSNLMLTWSDPHLALSERATLAGDPTSARSRAADCPTLSAHVKILDLGLALFGESRPNGREMTAVGAAMGTADYMSPEQVTDSHSVDIRSDIYSLGCTLYKLLSGRAPFSGPEFKNDVTKMMAHTSKAAPPIGELRADLPHGLAAILERMMAKKPEDRFVSPNEVAAALRPFAVGNDLGRLLHDTCARLGLTIPHGLQSSATLPLSGSAENNTDARMVGATIEKSETRPGKGTADAGQLPVLAGSLAGRSGWGANGLRVGLACAAALPLLLGIWIIIRIRDDKGNIVSETKVPANQTVEVEQDGKIVGRCPVEGKPAPNESMALPLPSGSEMALQSERPEGAQQQPRTSRMLSPLAAVIKPAELKGLVSWTVETTGHRLAVWCLAVHPDGTRFASGGDDGTIRIWDTETGKLKRMLIGHADGITCLSWSSDGNLIAATDKSNVVRVWDAAAGRQLALLQGLGALCGALWAPNRNTLAVGIFNGQGQLYAFNEQSRQLQSVGPLEARGHGVFAWSPDGASLAGYLHDGIEKVFLCDSQTRKITKTVTVNTGSNSGYFQRVTFSPDGKLFAVHGGATARILVCNADTGEVVRQLERGSSYGLAWAPDGNAIYVGGGETVKWDSATGEVQVDAALSVPGGLSAIAFGLGGKCVIGAGSPTIVIEGVGTGNSVQQIAGHRLGPGYPNARLRSLVVSLPSPSGRLLAIQENETDRFLVEVPSGKKLCDFSSYDAPMSYLVWSPDSSFVAGGTPAEVAVWDAKTGLRKSVLLIPGHGENPLSLHVAWSPDSSRLAALLNDESVAIWKAASNELTQQLKSPVRPNANPSDPSSPCIQFAWSPGGLHVVAIHADGRVHLWDAAGDRPVHELRTIPGQRIAWSPDGSELALLHPEGKLQIWNVAAQAVAQEVATKDTFGVAWSCTGDLLATAGISTSGDCLLHTWLAKRLVQKRTLHGIAHAMEIQLAFSGDGQSVFCRDGGWGLIRWEVDGDKAPVDTSGLGFDLDTMSQVVFCSSPALLRYWRTDMKTPLYSVLSTRQGQLIVSPEGRASGPPEAVNELVYVAETEDGQETLTAEEFAKRFGWSQR